MTDFVTTNITVAPPPDPSLVTQIWEQKVGQSFIEEMKANVTPRTAVEGGGSGGSRPTVGLVFPH